ncbi:hypothetical protein DIE23_10690 [Burkholderia sp. Bp9143]|nr:hypothetical protein DIE23_10690 [Burkholderia sp. Bp9143]
MRAPSDERSRKRRDYSSRTDVPEESKIVFVDVARESHGRVDPDIHAGLFMSWAIAFDMGSVNAEVCG